MSTEPGNNYLTISPVESKGLGMIASVHIPRGTLILSESPLFTISINSLPTTEATIRDILSDKSTSECTDYGALFNADAKTNPSEPLTGIFQTNALPCGGNDLNLESQSATEQGIFLTGSRFNSSCTPNTNAYWNSDAEEMEFRVMGDVQVGEELSIGYCDILKTRDERRKALKGRWGFDCHCDGCEFKLTKDDRAVDQEEKVKMSDMRRTSVGGLLRTVAFGYTVDSTKLALRLLKQEGILNFQETLSYDAYQLSTDQDRQPQEALAWAKKAWKASCILTGVHSPNSQRMLTCYEGAKIQIRSDSQWEDGLDSDALEELVDSDDDDGYYSD